MTSTTISFHDGRHLASARIMAGLTQKELADIVKTHVNTVKRFEKMPRINSRAASLEGIGKALKAKGIEAGIWPTPYVRVAG